MVNKHVSERQITPLGLSDILLAKTGRSSERLFFVEDLLRTAGRLQKAGFHMVSQRVAIRGRVRPDRVAKDNGTAREREGDPKPVPCGKAALWAGNDGVRDDRHVRSLRQDHRTDLRCFGGPPRSVWSDADGSAGSKHGEGFFYRLKAAFAFAFLLVCGGAADGFQAHKANGTCNRFSIF